MASDPLVVAAELPLAKVAEVLTDYDIGGLPLVDEDAARLMAERYVAQLVVVGDDTDTALGVVSDCDLMRAFAR